MKRLLTSSLLLTCLAARLTAAPAVTELSSSEIAATYTVPEGEPLAGHRICIDAASGGQIWGNARGYTGDRRGPSGLTEGDANLRTALLLWDLLTQAGAEVVMTRTFETRLSEDAPAPTDFSASRTRELSIRSRVAVANQCEFLISIQHGANSDPLVNATSALYFDPKEYEPDGPDDTAQQQHSAESVQAARAMAESIVRTLGPTLNLPTRAPRHGDHLILRETPLPAVIVECSVMTNPEEDARLADLSRNRQEAVGIFLGILDHFTRPGMGSVQP